MAQSVSFPHDAMRSQDVLLQLLQVWGLAAIHIDHRALSIGLGSARSSGGVLLGDGLSGGGGSHDGMCVTQRGKV